MQESQGQHMQPLQMQAQAQSPDQQISSSATGAATYPSAPGTGTDKMSTAASQQDAAGSSGPGPVPIPAPDVAESYEQQHVHSVYESIAPHFSATRHKPWPVVASFLSSLAPGSVGLDVGCGNGKYLAVNPAIHILGSDRSAQLVRIARDHGGERRADVAVADGLALPFRNGRADFAVCIAVLHHLSTKERRVGGVRALLDAVRDDGGKILVFVWALEQRSSRRGWDEGSDQDQLVPWVMKTNKTKPKPKSEVEGQGEGDGDGDTTYQRYYHLYKKGELEEDVVAAGGRVLDSGYDRDNWWVVGSRGEQASITS
ncbi:Uu.00g071860.m01.CDS01 [Anthostomella pinea]|uniref:Uu.00g071860.m01.CDS01 n=1 Tax=Anthostomella pinea TaxID=933095 RepID=A0AAI8VPB9_9PEZI|nr:Uu.00g071860.m01.CDS01 [Anthostomella pinea]